MAGGETSAVEERDSEGQEGARGILVREGVGQGGGDEWEVLEEMEVSAPGNSIFDLD